jgi:hypothetical protein
MCILSLGGPRETIGLPQKPIEREISFAEARDEAAEGCEASCDALNPLRLWIGPILVMAAIFSGWLRCRARK